jgi:hypothetical protein
MQEAVSLWSAFFGGQHIDQLLSPLLLVLLWWLTILALAALQHLQAFENINDMDYVTDKIYQALEAGCIPIYYGAPNIEDYIPDAQGIINLSKLASPATLAAQLEWLASDKAAYEEKLAWKTKKLEQLSPGEVHGTDHSSGNSATVAGCRLSALLSQSSKGGPASQPANTQVCLLQH